MPKEYMVTVGSNYYLIDLSSDEGYMFSEYGRGKGSVNAKYVLSICSANSLITVNILSILHDSMTNISELYYQGYKGIVKGSAMTLYKKIPKNFEKATYIAFRVIREECEGLSQVLVPFKANKVSFEMLDEIFGNVDWSKCNR